MLRHVVFIVIVKRIPPAMQVVQTVEKVQLGWAFSVFYDIMIWVM